jgi:hypothetical protein
MTIVCFTCDMEDNQYAKTNIDMLSSVDIKGFVALLQV